MLVRIFIFGLMIVLPLTVYATNQMPETITHAVSGSAPASMQAEPQIPTNETIPTNTETKIKASQDTLKTKLNINGEVQEIAWNNFINAVNNRALVMKNNMTQLVQDMNNNNFTIVEIMQKRIDLIKTDYDLLLIQQAALNDLYASLNDEQKSNANILLTDIIMERRRGTLNPARVPSGSDIFTR
jgi:hypothetical protein